MNKFSDRFFELSPSLICIANFEGYFIDINPAWTHTVGWTKEELTSRPFLDFVHPDDRAITLEKSKELADGKAVIRFSNRYMCKNGDVKHLLWSTNSSIDDKLIFAIAEDITEKKIQEQQLNNLVASLEEIVLEVGQDGTFLNVWCADESLLYIPKDKLLGKKASEFYPPRITEPFMRALGKALDTGRADWIEYQMAGFSNKWYRSKITPIHDDRMRKRALVTVQDITEVKESRQIFENLVQNIPGIVYRCLANKNWTMKFMSPSVESLTGFPASDFVDDSVRSYASIIHQEDRAMVEAKVHKAVTSHEPYAIVYRLVDRSSDVKWVFERGRAVHDEQGGVRWLDGTIVDITEQRQATERLTQTAKMSALGEMAAGLAHEINNPLAIIAGLANVLYEKANLGILKTSDIAVDLGKLKNTTERISKIVMALRVFSRDAESDPFEMANVQDIVNSTLVLCQERFAHHKVHVEQEIETSRLQIECRPVQISQVLLNLLNNAFDSVKDRPEARIKIVVSHGGDSVWIKVLDNGRGVRSDLEQKIFQPFFTTKEVGQGTGLGLSISRGIVETHKGQLSLRREGKNTAFVVELPKKQK